MKDKEKLLYGGLIAQYMINKGTFERTVPGEIYERTMRLEAERIEERLTTLSLFGLIVLVSLLIGFFMGEKEWYILLILSLGIVAYLLSRLLVHFLVKLYTRKKLQEKIGKFKHIKKELEKLAKKYPELYLEISKAFELAKEEGTSDSFLALFLLNYLFEVSIAEDNPLQEELLKRVMLSVASGNYILESLEPQRIASDKHFRRGLERLFDDLEVLLSGFEKSARLPEFFAKQTIALRDSVKEFWGTIDVISKALTEKKVAKALEKQTEKLREITRAKPISKTKVKEIRSLRGVKRSQTLTTISALDEEIIEIKTRAGTFYASMSHFKREEDTMGRKLEMLTDKELEVRIEAINSILEELERSKESLSKKDYVSIKNDYLSQQFATKQTLEKRRRGRRKAIICPYCLSKTSMIKRKCLSCNKELPFCIVCLNSIGKGLEVKICPHCFGLAHSEHFDEWLEKSSFCPYCKKEIEKKLEATVLEEIFATIKV